MQNRLLELMEALDLKQRDLAEKLGVRVQTFNAWVKGRETIPETRIFQICKLYNVREEWFRNGTGEMFESENDRFIKLFTALYSSLPPEFQAAFRRVMSDVHGVQFKESVVENDRELLRKNLVDISLFTPEAYARAREERERERQAAIEAAKKGVTLNNPTIQRDVNINL